MLAVVSLKFQGIGLKDLLKREPLSWYVTSFQRTKTKSELTELGSAMTVFVTRASCLGMRPVSFWNTHCPGKQGPGKGAAQEEGHGGRVMLAFALGSILKGSPH